MAADTRMKPLEGANWTGQGLLRVGGPQTHASELHVSLTLGGSTMQFWAAKRYQVIVRKREEKEKKRQSAASSANIITVSTSDQDNQDILARLCSLYCRADTALRNAQTEPQRATPSYPPQKL